MNTAQMAVFGAMHESNITNTMAMLRRRYEYLANCLEGCEDFAQAEPFNQERRIIHATMTAIKAEFAPGYFGDV